jgi:hypothetical protein
LVFLRDFSKHNGYNDRHIHTALNRRPHLDQPDRSNSVVFMLLSGLYSTVSAECWPHTTSNLWAHSA